MFDELQLYKPIALTGPLGYDQLANQLATADIGVSSYYSRTEYSGLKLIDYKAAGLAIIASGENGQPSVIDHGQTGWIAPPCDIEALSTAIIKLAADPELRKHLGRQARMEAEKCHSWKHTMQELEMVFRHII